MRSTSFDKATLFTCQDFYDSIHPNHPQDHRYDVVIERLWSQFYTQ